MESNLNPYKYICYFGINQYVFISIQINSKYYTKRIITLERERERNLNKHSCVSVYLTGEAFLHSALVKKVHVFFLPLKNNQSIIGGGEKKLTRHGLTYSKWTFEQKVFRISVTIFCHFLYVCFFKHKVLSKTYWKITKQLVS